MTIPGRPRPGQRYKPYLCTGPSKPSLKLIKLMVFNGCDHPIHAKSNLVYIGLRTIQSKAKPYRNNGFLWLGQSYGRPRPVSVPNLTCALVPSRFNILTSKSIN